MKNMALAILAIAALAVSSFAREGAQLVLTTKEGQVISGELLAVKHHSLILKDTSGGGLTQDIGDLETITLRKGSHLLAGLGIGLAAGAALGVGIGYAAGQKQPRDLSDIHFLSNNYVVTALLGGFLGALAGAGVGALIGSASSAPQTIILAKVPPEKIERLLTWLRSKGRFPEESY